ncbi:unnamed protein product [Protopolystoma xenopodis]|uniref:Uncharacterized protein n=1 Tax=Protopolystoma xenopodis TaxID=117903 RepID=A0A448WGT7_9PLAT|nr:unnamed protein product [Protopolystoma xenopodis]
MLAGHRIIEVTAGHEELSGSGPRSSLGVESLGAPLDPPISWPAIPPLLRVLRSPCISLTLAEISLLRQDLITFLHTTWWPQAWEFNHCLDDITGQSELLKTKLLGGPFPFGALETNCPSLESKNWNSIFSCNTRSTAIAPKSCISNSVLLIQARNRPVPLVDRPLDIKFWLEHPFFFTLLPSYQPTRFTAWNSVPRIAPITNSSTGTTTTPLGAWRRHVPSAVWPLMPTGWAKLQTRVVDGILNYLKVASQLDERATDLPWRLTLQWIG